MNVQVVADLHGRVLSVSRGFPGCWHDMHCLTDAGLTTLAGAAGTSVGDSGYQGSDMTTPNKKQPGQDRTESDLKHNTAIAVIRVAVEIDDRQLQRERWRRTQWTTSLRPPGIPILDGGSVGGVVCGTAG